MYLKIAEERILSHLMSKWERRNTSLVQIGLHSFTQPSFFWRAGFDVCATDYNHALISSYRQKNNTRYSYQRTAPNDLDFEDNSFDYAVLINYMPSQFLEKNQEIFTSNQKLSNIPPSSPSDSLSKDSFVESYTKDFFSFYGKENFFQEKSAFSEACRVAERGLIVLSRNAHSFASYPSIGDKFSPYSLWKNARKLCPQGQLSLSSVLSLPKYLQSQNNSQELKTSPQFKISPFPFGAILGLCIDFETTAIDSLKLFIKEQTEQIKTELAHSGKVPQPTQQVEKNIHP